MSASKKTTQQAVAPVAKPGDNVRHALSDISFASAKAGMAHDVLIAKIAAFADHPNADQLKAIQSAVQVGYIAGRIAVAAGRADATGDDLAAAAVLMRKAGAGAEKPNKTGRRTADEERFYGAARVFWLSLSIKAGAPTDAGTGKGRSAGGKASAAKRKARASTASVGAADVTVAATPRAAAGSKSGKALTSNAPVANSASEARAHVMQVSGALLAYCEANKARIVASLRRAIAALDKAAKSAALPD